MSTNVLMYSADACLQEQLKNNIYINYISWEGTSNAISLKIS